VHKVDVLAHLAAPLSMEEMAIGAAMSTSNFAHIPRRYELDRVEFQKAARFDEAGRDNQLICGNCVRADLAIQGELRERSINSER
jgi:hypothetical protein